MSHRESGAICNGTFFLATLIVFLLCGCSVGPDFIRPKAEVSPEWLEEGDPRVKTTASDYRNWWKAFSDPVLDRLIDQAYRENLSLRIAGVRVLEARAQLGIATGRLYPQTQEVSGSLQKVRISERSPQAALLQSQSGKTGPGPSPGSFLEYWQDEIGVNAGWEIDFWGKFRRYIESADANLLATVADYDNALVSLTADVAGSYVLIRTLEKRLGIARENVGTQEQILRITEDRFQYGTASRLDVEQAKMALKNTMASIPDIEARLRQAKNGLCVLLGLPPSDLSDSLEGSSGIPVSAPEVVVGIPNDLLRRRPDVRSAEYQAAAQSAQIGVAKADLYPAFSLTGMFGFLSSDLNGFELSDMFAWKSRNFQGGPSAHWNIFNYGRITNNVRVQDARFEQLLFAYQNAVLKAQQEVEDALVAFLRGQERAELLAQSTEAARVALELALLQYREGLKGFTTVLIAQQALLNEQDNLAVTLSSVSSNLVGVYRALGGGWEIREGKELVPSAVREEMAKRTDWGKLLTPASYNPPPPEEPKSTIRLPDW
jgi:NodT family efflux transporter outer membrane factor (OMF) lipoprotein